MRVRQLISEADARAALHAAWSAIDTLHAIYSGCDWCCGGGDELLVAYEKDIRVATEWLKTRGLAVPVHPEDCPVLEEKIHQWAEACNTFQDGWLDWYEENRQITTTIYG